MKGLASRELFSLKFAEHADQFVGNLDLGLLSFSALAHICEPRFSPERKCFLVEPQLFFEHSLMDQSRQCA
jgi:hypothetical protein